MTKKARVCIGNYTDLIDIKEMRVFGDRTTIIAKDGSKTTTHISNIVILEEPENANRCVSCGEVIPEGRQVCPKCEVSPKRKEGVWVIHPDGWYPYCNQCGYEPERPVLYNDNRTPYCANCGAKMRKEHEPE